MAVRDYYGLSGALAASIGSDSALLLVTPNLSGAIAGTFVNGEDVTWLAISVAGIVEVVKVISVDGNVLTVERGQEGTVAHAFTLGSLVSFQLTADSILLRIPSLPGGTTVAGQGLVEVSDNGPFNYNVNVNVPDFKGENGIVVLGQWPNIRFAFEREAGGCCGEDGDGTGDALTNIVGEGLAVAFVNGGIATVKVQPPVFTAGANISITGAWPNYTIAGTAGSGTVSSVGVGAGLQLTGSPNVNPTIAMQNTGVVVGTYGGVAINARGQITTVPTTFNPISIIETGTALTYARVGDKVTLTPRVAAVGVTGVVALADPDDDFDPADTTHAASPAVVAKALETLVTADVNGVSNYTPETAADYSALIGATSTPVLLAAGQKALVQVSATMVDGTTPTTQVPFGLGVFEGATLLKGNRLISQCNQSMTFIITGPINSALTLATTAVPAGSTVQSYSLSVIAF